MTKLQEACEKVLEAWQTSCYGNVSHQKAMGAAMGDLRSALAQQWEQQPVAFFPPLPRSVLRCAQTVVYDAMQMHQYAMRFTELLAAAPAPQAQDATLINEGTKSEPAPHPAQGFVIHITPEQRKTIKNALDIAYQRGCDERIALINDVRDILQSAQPVAPHEGGKQGGKQQLPPLQPVAQQDHIPDAGKMVKPVAQPLTPQQRVDICDACANLDYDDNFIGDVGKIIDLVEAAHGIREVK